MVRRRSMRSMALGGRADKLQNTQSIYDFAYSSSLVVLFLRPHILN